MWLWKAPTTLSIGGCQGCCAHRLVVHRYKGPFWCYGAVRCGAVVRVGCRSPLPTLGRMYRAARSGGLCGFCGTSKHRQEQKEKEGGVSATIFLMPATMYLDHPGHFVTVQCAQSLRP